jgi:hypothetical protein
VGFVKTFGHFAHRADLVQSVARAFRNCRSTGLPWQTGRGAVVQVEIFTSDLAEGSIQDLVKKVQGSGSREQVATEELERLMKAVAFDRKLFKEINDKSQNEEDKLQFRGPRRQAGVYLKK